MGVVVGDAWLWEVERKRVGVVGDAWGREVRVAVVVGGVLAGVRVGGVGG